MDSYSTEIEHFLAFLRKCENENTAAAVEEIDMDNRTQDILHNLELNENTQYGYICQGIELGRIRRCRRAAKDTKEVTFYIVDWIKDHRQAVKDLEKLLGDVRKAEKRTQNRRYTERTDVMKGLLE